MRNSECGIFKLYSAFRLPNSEFNMGGTGFEPVKALPSDLQSDPFDRFGNPPVFRQQFCLPLTGPAANRIYLANEPSADQLPFMYNLPPVLF